MRKDEQIKQDASKGLKHTLFSAQREMELTIPYHFVETVFMLQLRMNRECIHYHSFTEAVFLLSHKGVKYRFFKKNKALQCKCTFRN